MLCWAAFTAAGETRATEGAISSAETWLAGRAGTLEPDALVEAVYENYGSDRTFSVPILTMCALAGRLGDNPWRYVKPLPFELAAMPHQMFRWLDLNVVSYALPALIAIGQANFHNNPPANRLAGAVRRLTRNRTLRILQDIQPQNGGFLEATPLTSFVVMSLVAAGRKDCPVVSKGVDFLVKSVRPDGSWPIDTDLATWLTTLSVNALALAPDYKELLSHKTRRGILIWLLGQQYQAQHPYTHAAPGGWAWTDLSGAVPDADDTAGVLIAMHNLAGPADEVSKLPFDRSAPDLTAHALAAWSLWLEQLPPPTRKRTEKAIRRAVDFLRQGQTSCGSWIPLWFGNESCPRQENPIYGTARVLLGLNRLPVRLLTGIRSNMVAAVDRLLEMQFDDGSWGGHRGVSSIEETALAADALGALLLRARYDTAFPGVALPAERMRQALGPAVQWLLENTEDINAMAPAPIGLYFAGLWYFEELYPLIFAVSALQRAANLVTVG